MQAMKISNTKYCARKVALYALGLLAFCGLFASCSKVQFLKKDTYSNVDPIGEVEPDIVEVKVVRSALVQGVMLSGSLWTERDDGRMVWVQEILAGTAVGVYQADGAAEKKSAYRTSDGELREFVHVIYNSHDYWVQTLFLAEDAIPGVATVNNAILYDEAKDSARTQRRLPLGAMIAVFSDSKTDAESDFCRISYYDSYYGLLPDRYVKKSEVSTLSADSSALQIYAKLMARTAQGNFQIRNPTVRTELVENLQALEVSDSVKKITGAIR